MKLRTSLVTVAALVLAWAAPSAFAGGVAVGIRVGGPVWPAWRPYPVAVAAAPVLPVAAVPVPVYPAPPVAVVAPPVVVAAPVVAVPPPVVVGARYWGPRGVVVVH